MSPAKPPELNGRRFGSYVVEQLIGAGGMGAVYRAVQPEIGKKVAIKVLSAELSAHRELVQRFFAEARAVNLIQHDNIVDIFDFGQQDGLSFFVMELLKGRSLERVLVDEGQLSVGRTIDIALQIVDAIAAAHAIGIIHRDLKPDNIHLVTRAQRPDFVKLLDFGIAKLTAPGMAPMSRTMTGTIMGTPGYMPPEQGTGGAVDHRSDIFALGVILFRMLGARLPFPGNSHLLILNQQLTQEPPDLRQLRPEVSPSLATLIRQMMAKLPNDRPQSMKELAERLAPEMPADYGRPPSGLVRLSSEPTALTPPPAQPPTTLSGAAGQEISKHLSEMALPTRERTLKLTLAASLLFAGGIGALAFAIFSRHDPTPTARPNAPEPSISAPVVPPVPAAPAPAATFQVLVETEPPGAQVWSGAKSLGATPAKLTPVGDTMEIVLRMSGYREETLTLARDTEHAFVRLRREASTPKAKPAAPKKKPAIGLDD